MTTEALRGAINAYFTGEKYGAMIIFAMGVLGLGFAGVLAMPRWDLRPFAITLGVFAVVEIAIGIGVLVKAGPRAAELLANLDAAAVARESVRMTGVQRTFLILQITWISLLAICPIIAVTQKERFWITGIAAGVVVNVALVLAFDLIAERRGAVYLDALEAAHGAPTVE